ncbi:MAG: molybdopterin molybdotransferase MoeA [Steroidobacteraceae bacterium]|nr:molybdopterin molybdotransferase MoeA [Steroidobacteraceae bacterium]MCC7199728.1 molybdopterin molybdotransferase MoeA [Gammaproteobacteria bacterium]
MITPAEAAAAIAAALQPADSQVTSLGACAGQALADDVSAERDAPPFDRVAMDGVALASVDYVQGCRDFPIRGIQAAGAPALALTDARSCLEAMTGAVLPRGCDAVVPVERITVDGGLARLPDGLAVVPGLNVHVRGSDVRAGARVLATGTIIGPAEVAILASAGLAELRTSRPLRIAVVSTGDELIDPGQPIADHQVRRSNPWAIAAALQLAGFGRPTDRHLRDDLAALQAGIGELLAVNDVLILSGGVSAGRFDHVPAALGNLGVNRVFHKVAQRPGKPLWFGTGPAGQAVFALPGNPVSVLACLARYVLPALALLSGGTARSRTLRLASAYRVKAPLALLLPVTVEYDSDGCPWAWPHPTQGSGDFHALAGSAGIIELPPGPAVVEHGTRVILYPW